MFLGMAHQEADPPHALGLLRARRERPRRRRAADERDELAPSQGWHRLSPPVQPVSRTLSLARRDPQVLGTTLNRSELSARSEMSDGTEPLLPVAAGGARHPGASRRHR